MKHTKGEWKVKNLFQLGVKDVNKKGIYEDNNQIAVVNYSTHFNKEEAQANAKLIAAAPDLLEACEIALEVLEKIGYSTSATASQLRYAIKKATL